LRDATRIPPRRYRTGSYEILEDGGTYYGELPGFEGVYANADTLEECRDELEEVLEEWVLFRVSRNLDLPTVNRDRAPGAEGWLNAVNTG
jgi:predicted RNase H-like HicB family nuclease